MPRRQGVALHETIWQFTEKRQPNTSKLLMKMIDTLLKVEFMKYFFNVQMSSGTCGMNEMLM